MGDIAREGGRAGNQTMTGRCRMARLGGDTLGAAWSQGRSLLFDRSGEICTEDMPDRVKPGASRTREKMAPRPWIGDCRC